MTITQYRNAQSWFEARSIPGLSNTSPDNLVLYNTSVTTKLYSVIGTTLAEALEVLFVNGLYRKPNFWKFVKLGRIGLKLIIAIIQIIKHS